MSGCAVEVKRACCEVAGGWTWSKVKTCFLAEAAAGAEAAALGPEEGEASTETVVGDTALMTDRWKRAGMELASCVVVGRMRRATWTEVVAAFDDDGEGAMVCGLRREHCRRRCAD